MRILVNNKLVKFVCLLSIISLLSGTILFKNTTKTRFHGDESGYITVGYYYADLLLRYDFEWEKWRCIEYYMWGSWLNMNLGKLLIGIPLKMYYKTADRSFYEFYWFDHSLQWNEKEGKVPPPDIVLPARHTSAFFGVLCCILLFVISYFCINRWMGALATVLLLANTLFIETATRVMTDVHYNFFLLCLCLASILLLRFRKKTHIVLASSLCGCFAGLACSIKVSGIVLGGLFFLTVVIYKGIISKLEIREITLYSTVFCFSAMAVIYTLNPYFWPSFKEIRGKATLRELRALSEEVVTAKLQTEGIRERYPQLSDLSHVLEFPMLFIRWNSYMKLQSSIPSASWHGNRFKTLHREIFASYSSFPLEWIFLCIGTVSYCMKIGVSLKNKKVTLWSIPFLYFLINYLFILTFAKLNWGRYYLPTVAASRIVVAGGIYEVVTQVYHVIYHWKGRILRG